MKQQPDKVEDGGVEFQDFPFIIGWELTLTCNLQCRHCGSSAGPPRSGELTTKEALSICEQFPDLLVREVDFTGGEPLLHPGWFEIATRLRDLGIDTKIISNGSLLTEETIRKIRLAGISGIGVSLDGPQEVHDSVRGRSGQYLAVLAAIKLVQGAGLPLTVLTTVHAQNIDRLPELLSTLMKLGVKWWQLQPIFHFGRGQESADLHLTEEQYLALGAFVSEYDSTARSGGLEIAPADSYGYFTICDFRQPPWGGCPAGRHGCGITSDGRVKGCLSFPDELTEGSLREKDLWDIWFRPDAFAFSRSFRQSKLGSNCAECDMSEQCRGGCSAMSYGCTDRFWNNPYCFTGIKQRNPSLFSSACSALSPNGQKGRGAQTRPIPPGARAG